MIVPVIEIQGLTKNYGEVQAVKNLNLSILPGEMFCLVGPDGAGKTTTIRMLCGIIKPTSGEARILGMDIVRQSQLGGEDPFQRASNFVRRPASPSRAGHETPPCDQGGDSPLEPSRAAPRGKPRSIFAAREKIKQNIGYLSQKFSLYGDLTVDENIEFFAEIHQVKNYKKRREELLEFTRLRPFRQRLAEQLSGGMRQKLALACTLIHTPRIIFLDEPTTGVDAVSRRDFWKILSDLLEMGITIFLTTPYLDEAERCSRVGLMNEGELVVVDTPQNIKTLMKGVIIEIVCKQIRPALNVLKQSSSVIETQIFGDRLNVVVSDIERDLPSIQSELQKQGIEIDDWRVIPPSLENVFISVTRSR